MIGGRYAEPESLSDAVNSEYDETESYIALDESFMIFISIRPVATDTSTFISATTEPAVGQRPNLGRKVNSEGYDLNPMVSPDGKYFFFASDRRVCDRSAVETSDAYAMLWAFAVCVMGS